MESSLDTENVDIINIHQLFESPDEITIFLFIYRPEIVHVWRDSCLSSDGPKHSAQMVVDGVSYLTETVCSISAQPSKAFTDWVADKIAPSYWKQNSEIIVSRFVFGIVKKLRRTIHYRDFFRP